MPAGGPAGGATVIPRQPTVVSLAQLHHWPDPASGLAEVRRVLKPDGRAYIYDLADWILSLTHHGVRQSKIVGESPLALEAIEPVLSLGSVPLVTRFCLQR